MFNYLNTPTTNSCANIIADFVLYGAYLYLYIFKKYELPKTRCMQLLCFVLLEGKTFILLCNENMKWQ